MSGNVERIRITEFTFMTCRCNPRASLAVYTIHDEHVGVMGCVNTQKFLTLRGRTDKVHPFGDFETFHHRTEGIKIMIRTLKYFKCMGCGSIYWKTSRKAELLFYYMLQYLEQIQSDFD